MAYSYINTATFTEKRAKKAAKVVTRFLDSKGLELKHTQALDLIGVMAGFGDWRSLQAALTRRSVGTPERMTLEEFEDEFKPMSNHLVPGAAYNGYAFETYGPELTYVQELAAKHPGKVWTVVDGDDNSSWLVSGLHFVNRVFYVITNVATAEGEDFEIPYGHESTDKLFEITVFDNNGTEIAYKERVYAASASAAREQQTCEIDEEVSQILENEGQPYVIVEEVPA
jgi:hypothetical protein